MRLHTGSRPYKCPYCPYTANNQENIRKHVMKTGKHVGLPVYPCNLCNFGSNVGTEFREHLMKDHKHELDDLGVSKLSVIDVASYVGIYDKSSDSRAKELGQVIQLTEKQLNLNKKKGTKRSRALSIKKEKEIESELELLPMHGNTHVSMHDICEDGEWMTSREASKKVEEAVRSPLYPRAIPTAWLQKTNHSLKNDTEKSNTLKQVDGDTTLKISQSVDLPLVQTNMCTTGTDNNTFKSSETPLDCSDTDISRTIFILEQVADDGTRIEHTPISNELSLPCPGNYMDTLTTSTGQVLQLSADTILPLLTTTSASSLPDEIHMANTSQLDPLVTGACDEQNVMYVVYQDE